MPRLTVVLTLCATLLMPLVAVDPGYGDDFFDESPIDELPIPSSDDRPMLGVQMSPPSRRVIEDQGLDAHTGVYVHRVYEDTAAAGLGVQRGDVITAINGRPLSSMTDLREIVLSSQVGEDVDVVVRRDGQDVSLAGGSYQTWPEAIPYRELDAAAEKRYRELQQRRMGQRLRNLDRLADQADGLQQQLDDLENMSDLADMLGADEFLPPDALPGLPDGSLPEVLPALLLAIPSWQMRYAFDVRPDVPARLAPDEVRLEPIHTVAPVADEPGRLTVSLYVSSEVL